MRDRIWITKDGTRIKVADMETSHIANSIRMIQRRKNWRRQYLPRLHLELKIRKLKC